MEKLLDKKSKYTELINQVTRNDYGIESKVEEYRKKLVEESEIDRAKKLEKLNSYLEIIDELILEKMNEAEEAEKNCDDNSCEEENKEEE